MSRRWLAAVSVTVAVGTCLALLLRSHMVARRTSYWALAEGGPGRLPEQGAGMRLLFVGNSFVHYNGGAEKVVAELLDERVGTKVYARRYAPGGYTWQQHLADAADPARSLHKLLGPGGDAPWDYVIFQEQSQAPALGGKDSLESLRALEGLAQLATERGAHVMLLMTWGYELGDPGEHRAIFPDYHAMQERLTEGYISLAASLRRALNISASVAPAGLGWQRVHRLSRGAAAAGLPAGKESFHALYAKDGIHPSPVGTYLEACIIASAITGCRTGGLSSKPLDLSSDWQGFLQGVADEVVFEAGAMALPPYPWTASGCAVPSLSDDLKV